VEWLEIELEKLWVEKYLSPITIKPLLDKAKEMEKKRIIDAYHTNPLEAKWKNIGINYYNETYGGNK
jgi:hypothetical protein